MTTLGWTSTMVIIIVLYAFILFMSYQPEDNEKNNKINVGVTAVILTMLCTIMLTIGYSLHNCN